ncbi:hypothetical protein SAMN06265795_109107 [Noviherbaspirillum humi]|uniref:Uncharacterized protein n=1 Tax=Noviherbaspirillum humi TaxID=1688639 RepID=A0A239IH43_9BURK|nr:hypothetical protein SAMN06265795_109107 [Noviherbaspirillum humi]
MLHYSWHPEGLLLAGLRPRPNCIFDPKQPFGPPVTGMSAVGIFWTSSVLSNERPYCRRFSNDFARNQRRLSWMLLDFEGTWHVPPRESRPFWRQACTPPSMTTKAVNVCCAVVINAVRIEQPPCDWSDGIAELNSRSTVSEPTETGALGTRVREVSEVIGVIGAIGAIGAVASEGFSSPLRSRQAAHRGCPRAQIGIASLREKPLSRPCMAATISGILDASACFRSAHPAGSVSVPILPQSSRR